MFLISCLYLLYGPGDWEVLQLAVILDFHIVKNYVDEIILI